MATLLFYYLTSHIISFSCSILEAVLLCCTNGYVSVLKKRRPKEGQALANLKKRIDRPLAAILTINTAAHTFGAAGVGATAADMYGEQWIVVISIILTLTMLLVTEMIPKTIGALYWKQLAPKSVYFIKGLIFITYPFVIGFEYIAKLLSRGRESEKITHEEIRLILEEGNQAGVLHTTEHDMLESIFRLGSKRVNSLMVPRVDIEWIDVSQSQEDIMDKLNNSPHNRFPVCDSELDNIIGLASTKDILQKIVKTGSFEIKNIAKAPIFVPENMRVIQLLEIFKKTPDHIVVVTDEYGGVQGIVTLHDVLESIVGDVPTTTLMPTSQVVQRKDGSYLVDGMLSIDDFKKQFSINTLTLENKIGFQTLGGFCMLKIGSIPKVGDHFICHGLRFKVIKMDGRRVERVLIKYVT